MAINYQTFQSWKLEDIKESAFVIVGSDVRFFEGIGKRTEATSDDSGYEELTREDKAFFNTPGYPEIVREALKEWEKIESKASVVIDSERFIQWCDYNAAGFAELEDIDKEMRVRLKRSVIDADSHNQIAHLDLQSSQLQEKMYDSLVRFNVSRELGPVVTLEDNNRLKDTIYQSLRDKIKDIWSSDHFEFLKVFKSKQEISHSNYFDKIMSSINDDDQVVITRSPLCILRKDGSEYANFANGKKVTETEFASIHSVNGEVSWIGGAEYKQWAKENKGKIYKEFEAAMHSNNLSSLGDSFEEQQQVASRAYKLIHNELMDDLRGRSQTDALSPQVTNTAAPSSSPTLH